MTNALRSPHIYIYIINVNVPSVVELKKHQGSSESFTSIKKRFKTNMDAV